MSSKTKISKNAVIAVAKKKKIVIRYVDKNDGNKVWLFQKDNDDWILLGTTHAQAFYALVGM